jgi:hypothetical protein
MIPHQITASQAATWMAVLVNGGMPTTKLGAVMQPQTWTEDEKVEQGTRTWRKGKNRRRTAPKVSKDAGHVTASR